MRIRSVGLQLLLLAVVIAPVGAQVTDDPDVTQVGDSTGTEASDSLFTATDDSLSPPVLPEDPASVLMAYHEALRSGDGEFILTYTSSAFLESVDMMLEGLKESLDRDSDGTISRMLASGYTATSQEMERWDPSDYLLAAVEVPLMRNRYSMYVLETGEPDIDGNSAEVPLTFTTTAGATIPFLAELQREDGIWKVSSFLGLNSFP